MAIVSSFDQWKKDVFFSAAEEVQESADIMESVYRVWVRNRKDGYESEASAELFRELQTALGTAKWQLEEFERAAELSHWSHPAEDNAINRHRHFVAAIENQVLRVEKELSDSISEEGKQPLCWVQLDEKERDDLTTFLSGAQQNDRERDIKDAKSDGSSSQLRNKAELKRDLMDAIPNNKDERDVEEPSTSQDNEVPNDQIRVLTAPETGDWKIAIADEEEADKRSTEARQEQINKVSAIYGLPWRIRSIAELRWLRSSFWKVKCEEHIQLRHRLSNQHYLERVTRFTLGVNRWTERSRNRSNKVSTYHQIAGGVVGFQRHLRGSHCHIQFAHSLGFTFLLVLTIVLVVPFVLYST